MFLNGFFIKSCKLHQLIAYKKAIFLYSNVELCLLLIPF
jgi:hypothetical protein